MHKKRRKILLSMEHQYVKQMFIGCENKDCAHAFCRCQAKEEIILIASEQLKKYGDLFLCENRVALMEYKYEKEKNKDDTLGQICLSNNRKKPKIDFKNIKDEDNKFNMLFEMFFNVIDFYK